MPERILKPDAFVNQTYEEVPCIECGKPVGLHYNGGELDERTCCGVVYQAVSVGYQILAKAPPQPS